jgi:lipopolysaccharide/colanic/teichoic acid biosynthesis glycosyltransferase
VLKRIFDILLSGIGILLLLPIFLFVIIWIKADSKGSAFYRQLRVGQFGKDFSLLKFRSMRIGSDKAGLLTIGGRDPRVTRSGVFIRKYKIDELPQLINVFLGQMSLVGPRPEVRKYVDLYNETQRRVLLVKPGITDLASLEYFDENELLAKSEHPEKTYVEVVMPHKLELNLQYIDQSGLLADVRIILRTIKRVVFR